MNLYIITFFEQGHTIDQYIRVFKDIQQASQFAVNQKQDYESFRIDKITEVDNFKIIIEEVEDEKDIPAH